MRYFSALFLAALLALSCGTDYPQGLAPNVDDGGPVVIWDIEKRPLPEIPFPNDVATQLDETSPTGRRINISLIAPTELEAEVRKKANMLDGFGTFAPITVSFSKPLDLSVFYENHSKDRDFANDVVFLIDVTPVSPTYGEAIMLDIGHGFFPLALSKTSYFPLDPRGERSNLLFETENEDSNGNGIFEPGEDTDFDGVFDKPNIWPPHGNEWDNLVTFYESETNTLILRPVVPLREQTTYAVVITRRVRGTDSRKASSPFPSINHLGQTESLEPLKEILPAKFGIKIDEVAFAWSFTTQSITLPMKVIREGLYGYGVMKKLAEVAPAKFNLLPLKNEGTEGNRYLINVSEIVPFFHLISGIVPGGKDMKKAVVESYDFVDYIVAGEFTSPNFLVDRDGLSAPGYPADIDESFDIDPLTGAGTYAPSSVMFVCTVPKENPQFGFRRPFPVSIFMHGTGGSKLHGLGFAGQMARHGIALCGIDGWAHGMPFPKEGQINKELVMTALESAGYGPIYKVIEGNRARDIDMDGNPDVAGDYWIYDPFHTRDVVRQTVVDLMQFIRVLRSCNGKMVSGNDVNNDGKDDLMCDFNGDGIVDIEGGENNYSAWGVSLGGIVTGVLAGIEPALSSAAVIAGGGGLTDIAIRSTQIGVPQMAILPIMGTLILGERVGEKTSLSFYIPNFHTYKKVTFASVPLVNEGDKITITNIDTGEEKSVNADKDGNFRAQIQADALKATEIRALLGFDPAAEGFEPLRVVDTTGSAQIPKLGDQLTIEVVDKQKNTKAFIDKFGMDTHANGIIYAENAPLVNIYEGFGFVRQTPDFRRFVGIAQIFLEAGDPVNWAPHYYKEPIAFPESDPHVTPGVNVYILNTIGDTQVNIATGISLARAAGIIDYMNADGRYGDATQMDVLIDNYVVEGISHLKRWSISKGGPNLYSPETQEITDEIFFDPDNLSEGNDGFPSPKLDPPLRITRQSGSGVSALRFGYISPGGYHGLLPMSPDKEFDINTFIINQIAHFFMTGGREIKDDLCLEDNSCPWIPQTPP